MESAEYDFHQYSLLKLRLSAYVDLLRNSDSIRLDIRIHVLFLQYVLCTVNCISCISDFLNSLSTVLCILLYVLFVWFSGFSIRVLYIVLFSMNSKSDFIRFFLIHVLYFVLCTVYMLCIVYYVQFVLFTVCIVCTVLCTAYFIYCMCCIMWFIIKKKYLSKP